MIDETKPVKRSRPGRPLKPVAFSGKCDVRLTKKENEMLNYLAERNEASRSDIMRTALKELYKFNTEEE